jgi:hypothetical protein
MDAVTVRHAVTTARAEFRKQGWKNGRVIYANEFEWWLQTGKLPEQATLGNLGDDTP